MGCKNYNHNTLDKILDMAQLKSFVNSNEKGINYFDTAPYYCNKNSEAALGHGVKDFRDKVLLSSKFPCEVAKKPGDYRRQLESSLERMGTDHIDFYLFHALNDEHWEKSKNSVF